MYERFTDYARTVMELANEEAKRFNHRYIETEDVLLGLVDGRHGVACHVLKNHNVDRQQIDRIVATLVESGPDMVSFGKFRQFTRGQKSHEFSLYEAQNLNHEFLGTGHILLGLVRTEESVAALVLRKLGLNLEDARNEVIGIIANGLGEMAEGDTPVLPWPRNWIAAVREFIRRLTLSGKFIILCWLPLCLIFIGYRIAIGKGLIFLILLLIMGPPSFANMALRIALDRENVWAQKWWKVVVAAGLVWAAAGFTVMIFIS